MSMEATDWRTSPRSSRPRTQTSLRSKRCREAGSSTALWICWYGFRSASEMDYVWGPAADPVWGNAVLSRLPIISSQNHRMPNNDTVRLDRAFLTVEVDVDGGETIDVVATHFHSGDGDSAIRIPQAKAVLETVDKNRTSVLLGDFNAHPDHPEMLLFADAGFNDAFVASRATGDGFTYPADNPWERIDYVWTSPDLKVPGLICL